jgi:hypothetical protein
MCILIPSSITNDIVTLVLGKFGGLGRGDHANISLTCVTIPLLIVGGIATLLGLANK